MTNAFESPAANDRQAKDRRPPPFFPWFLTNVLLTLLLVALMTIWGLEQTERKLTTMHNALIPIPNANSRTVLDNAVRSMRAGYMAASTSFVFVFFIWQFLLFRLFTGRFPWRRKNTNQPRT